MFNQGVVGYGQDICATTEGLGIAFNAGLCGSQALQLGRSVGYFSPLESCMVASSTMKTNPRVGGFQVTIRSRASVPCV